MQWILLYYLYGLNAPNVDKTYDASYADNNILLQRLYKIRENSAIILSKKNIDQFYHLLF